MDNQCAYCEEKIFSVWSHRNKKRLLPPHVLPYVCLSVCPHVDYERSSHWMVFSDFYIEDIYENLSRRSKFG